MKKTDNQQKRSKRYVCSCLSKTKQQTDCSQLIQMRDINDGMGAMKETNKGCGFTQKPARAGSHYHQWD